MSAIKTPQQVAADTLAVFNQYPDSTVAALMAHAIEADRAQRLPVLVVIDRDGRVLTDSGDAEVIDLAFLREDPDHHGFEQEDIEEMSRKLLAEGWESVDEDLREWWATRSA